MDVYSFSLPFPPDRVWQALPAAVQRTRRAIPGAAVTGQDGRARYEFSTGMTMLTDGMRFSVDLYEQPDDTSVLRVSASLNFGVVDWGEGRRTARELYTRLHQLLS